MHVTVTSKQITVFYEAILSAVNDSKNVIFFSLNITLNTNETILPGDHGRPRTSDGRMRLARVITYLLRYRFDNFANENNRNPPPHR